MQQNSPSHRPARCHSSFVLQTHNIVDHLRCRHRALVANGLALALSVAMAQANAADEIPSANAVAPTAGTADSDAGASKTKTLDSVSVTGASITTRNAVDTKRKAAVQVDSLDNDSIQVHAEEDSIAQKLLAAPGVSVLRDEDQPRYITVRGIEANLNSTTLDGITMASVGDSGGGERKINLQLIPNDIADRVDVYKTFSAEQNPDGIGGDINLVSGSAFDHPKNSLHVDASGNYHDLSNDSGANAMPQTKSRWGNGLNGRYSTTFGGNDEFGITVSARRQQFQTDQNKLFQTTQYFYDGDGNYLSGPSASGWNGMSAPYNTAYYADNRSIKSYGGSVKLEWWPSDSPWRASLLGYEYGMQERRTENGYEFLTDKAIYNQTPTSGTEDIASGSVIFGNNVWNRNNRGVLGSLQWAQDNQHFNLTAGYTRDRLYTNTASIRLTTTPENAQLNYASSGEGEIYNITSLSESNFLSNGSYVLNSASQVFTQAIAEVKDVRADYSFNADAGDRGFGFVAGAEYKRLGVDSNYSYRTYTAGGDYSSDLYDPGWNYPKSSYALPFFNYAKFLADGGWSSLTLNQTASAYNSQAADFKYVETVQDAYVSLHYATDFIEAVLGLRYDDTHFTAYTPAINAGVVNGTTTNKGGYNNPLPSLNVVAHLNDTTNLRASASQTIGRPIPSNIAQAEVVSCDTGDGDCSISRGNPDLKPERSTNLDLSAEHYFNHNTGFAALGVFHKKIKDNIASIATETVADDGSITTVTTPVNLQDSKVQGVEFSLVQRDLALAGQHFDVMFNATHMAGRMTYVGTTGSRTIHQLIDQPNNVANLGLTWHIPWLDSSLTVSENYTDRYLITIGGNSWQDRGFRSRYTTDMSWSSHLNQHWSLGLSASNLFGEDQYETVGDDYQYMRNLNNYGATYALHVTYDLN